MANIKLWTDEMDDILLDFFAEGKKKGISVSRLAEDFSLKYPDFTKEQARVHYYFLLKNKVANELYDLTKPWSDEEDDLMFSLVRKYQGEMSKTKIFEMIGNKIGRDPQAVAARFYKLKRNSSTVNSAEELLLILSTLDPSQAGKFVEALKKMSEEDKKKKEIEDLKKELKKINEERDILKENLKRKNDEIRKLSFKTAQT